MTDTILARFSRLTLLVANALALASCGDDVDAYDCLRAERPHHLRVVVPGGAHDAVALRNANEPWEQQATGTPVIDACVGDHFVVGVVCAGADDVLAVQYARAASDGAELEVFACGGTDEWVTVTGTMQQAGSVSFGRSVSLGYSPGWTYSHLVRRGAHDVVASDASGTVAGRSNRIALRRGRSYTTDTTEPDIDLAAEGVDLVPVSLAVAGLEPDDSFTTEVWLRTLSGAEDDENVIFQGSTLAVYRVPPSVFEAGETDGIFLEASSPPYRRSATTTSSSFELLPRLTTGVMVEPGMPSRATWSALPMHDEISVRDSDGEVAGRRFQATRAWLDATGATELSFDTSMPGMEPRLHFVGAEAELGVHARDGDTRTSSYVRVQ